MGRDAISVVDSNLKVFGVDNLRIADGSIMPRVTTGNTMAPCVIIGERATEIIRKQHQIEALSRGAPPWRRISQSGSNTEIFSPQT